MLSDKMIEMIEHNTLGFVATVNSKGVPNLSPKGTFAVLDNKSIGFCEIRSPNTQKNIETNPIVAVNFFDLFERKALKISARAEFVEISVARENGLLDCFSAWSELHHKTKGIFILHIQNAQLITSPVYDIGAVEHTLRDKWREHFLNES
jgi:general stress protein 26